ncbi:MAG: hypothetical protein IKS55_05935 [Oscillospiraceae bacterium]|nr:hypothetical protein [Oscillospiraceae bacterium]
MPNLYVVTGPSGTGLSDTLAELFRRRPDLSAVLPVTSRHRKEGETDGIGFRFYDLDEWNALRESGDLLEETEFAGNDYGTSRTLVDELLRDGKNVLLSLEPDRAAQVKKNNPGAVCIWVEPSSEELLRARLSTGGRSEREIEVRLRTAAEQRARSEFCDLRIDDDDPALTLLALEKVIG